MKISLVTVALTTGSDYRLTRESVRRQTYGEIEHITVYAGGGAPEPGTIAVKAPARGVYNAINTGLARATGDVTGLLHGGDTFATDDVLEKVAEAFTANPDVDYLYGDIRYVSGMERRAGRIQRGCEVSRDLLTKGIYPPHPTLYMRREAIAKTGPYTENYAICGDFDMWVRLYESGLRGLYLPIPMVEMTTGGLSTRLRSRLWTNNVEKLRVLRAHNLPANPLRLAAKHAGAALDLLKNILK